MPRRLPLPLLLLTHATALFAGWAVFSRTGLVPPDRSAFLFPTPPPAPTKSMPREAAATWSATDILHDVDQALTSTRIRPDGTAKTGAATALRGELAKTGTDARTAFESMIAEVLQAEDAFANGTNAAEIDHDRIRTLLVILAQDHGPASLAAYLGRSPSLDSTVAEAIGTALRQDASFEKLTAVKDAVPPEIWSSNEHSIVDSWPVAKLDDLLRFALAENQPGLLGSGGDNDGQHRAAWLAHAIADDSLPAGFRSALLNSPGVRLLLAQSPDLPAATRLEAIPDFSPLTLGNLDIDQVFKRPEDWAYRFQTGQATPEEILAAVTAATPQLAAANPAELRQALALKLAETDPARALTLLDDLSPTQRSALILTASLSNGYGGKPDQFLALLSQVPDTPETRDQRLLAWQIRSARYLDTSTGDYLRWLDAMPPGVNRDMALSATAAQLQTADPAQAAGLRRLIADPAIEQNTDLLR